MLRHVHRLFSKPTATRRGAATYSAAAVKKQTTRGVNGHAPFATLRPAFKTSDLAQLLKKSIPSTANVLAIDNTSKNADSASSLFRFLLSHNETLSQVQKDPKSHHPLLVVVETTLKKDDAEANEFVLRTALQQQGHFKGATAIVLDSSETLAARSLLMNAKGSGAAVNIEEVAANNKKIVAPAPAPTPAAAPAAPAAVKAPVKVEKKVEEKSKQDSSPPTKKASRSTTVTKTPSPRSSKEVPLKKNAKSAAGGEEVPAPLSYVPPPGAVKMRSTPGAPTRTDTREALRRMFKSSLAAPFQPPQQVERVLFSGAVDRVRFADLLNLPLCGSGEVHVLYYRLTGAGACRTPLITITQAMEEVCQKRVGNTTKNVDVLSTDRVPMLLFLSASFLVGEDADLLCKEYQKTLQARLSEVADVTVMIAPSCFTEKNVLFTLRTAAVDREGNTGEPREQQYHGREDELPPTPGLLRRGEAGSAHTMASLTEDTLRCVVTNALEEVALRHEKSTDHLVSTLKKLVEYWSRERVIELMEGLQSEREVLQDVMKEFGDIQQQLRNTQEAMKALRVNVQSIDDKMESSSRKSTSVSVNDTAVLTKTIGSLEKRMAESLSTMPSKQQIALDLREEMESLQKGLQEGFDHALSKNLKNMHEEQQRVLQNALQRNTSTDEKTQQLMQQTLQELPERIQTGMEKALQSFSVNSDGQTARMLESHRKLTDVQVSELCEKMCKSVEEGQTRIERAVVGLLSAKPETNTAAPEEATVSEEKGSVTQ
ncbi:hypothetical protein DQ04_06741000 [Trypanosoma grayi]|uniref:hypothetical protein n=1 Tax=Trypanosoma grayi TaxID=71804 RepID=UPI0004F40A56|nr:hypothetical protein DQ04_06741000 [Trypanosoma grayi]KEG08639.1 hypothetical protein DQ04_06741000 [Trypanosoma grayi]